MLGYAALHDESTGRFGLTRTSAFNSYARVAPWADCREFDPPSGTEFLCDPRPEAERPSVGFYVYDPGSPAVQRFGSADFGPGRPADMAKLRSFARAAMLGQPTDYARFVGRDLLRLVAPESYATHSGPSAEALFAGIANPNGSVESIRRGSGYYTTPAALNRPAHERRLRSWESVTRLRGPLALVLFGLAIAAPFLARGRLRTGAVLMLGATLAVTIPPILTLFYGYRYTIPATGPLAAAAAIGAYALYARVASARSRSGASAS
jgi:hypothetical protein